KAFPVSVSEDEDLGNTYLLYRAGQAQTSWEEALEQDKENVDDAEIIDLVQAIPNIKATEVTIEGASAIVNDPEFSKQWYWQIYGEELFEEMKKLRPKRKARIAIVDTGVDGDHEDLSEVFGQKRKTDQNGHGTHCAGIAGAITNNQKGIASLNINGKWIEIVSFEGLNSMGIGTDYTVAQAIYQAAVADADVISLSLGGPALMSRIKQLAINYARRKGAIVVVAAGNENSDAKNYSPANVPGVIVVSAVDQRLRKASFSNRNTSLEMPIAAPGVDIHSLQANGTYISLSGTSMATPMVAGVIGIMKAINPSLTTKEVWEILQKTGRSVPNENATGLLINPLPAIKAAKKQRGIKFFQEAS
ncbi:MAG: S8 family serine peptidase, partial [Bacteroidia bacterium]|nr:S8 family serine peptidase [Bacteroidia bacterium]